MKSSKNILVSVESATRRYVHNLSDEQKRQLLAWSKKALAIRESPAITKVEKAKRIASIKNADLIRIFVARLSEKFKDKIWTNQSWARRLGFAGLATGGLTFGGTAVGIATMGAGIGVPLMVLTAAGGVILGAAIDEIQKELYNSSDSIDPTILRKNQLQYAYLQTCYSVEIPGAAIDVCPIKQNLQFRMFLNEQKINCWAIITPDNPYSNQLSDSENESRRTKLRSELEARGFKYWLSNGRDPNEKWKPEIGFFIANVDFESAKNLGRDFNQNAIVFGTSTAEAEVIWLNEV